MSDPIRLSDLNALTAGSVADTDHIPITRSGEFTRRVDVGELRTAIQSNLGDAALANAADFAIAAHNHDPSNITGLIDSLNAKADDTLRGAANGIATLGPDAKIPAQQIPAIAITETFVVADEASMLALTAEVGDHAIRTDQGRTYVLQQAPSANLANWIELQTYQPVRTVQGQTGDVVIALGGSTQDGLLGSTQAVTWGNAIAANTTGITAAAGSIATNTTAIATKITDPGGATEGQVLSYVGGTLIWASAAGGDVLWSVVASSTYTASAGQRLAITSTSAVTLTLPASGAEGDAIEVENIGSASISLVGSVNNGLNPLLLPSTKRSRLIWASGWQCRDATYPTYGLTGTFTDGAAITSTDEILYAIGTNLGSQSWVNPHTAGRIQVVMSSVELGTPEQFCDRSNSTLYSGNLANSWFGIDFGMGTGRQVQLSAFRMQLYASTGYVPQSCVIEGSNGLAGNSVANFNAATWDPIINIGALGIANSASAWSSNHAIASSQWYRWIRVRQTALNSSGNNHFCIGEMAFGGKIRFT